MRHLAPRALLIALSLAAASAAQAQTPGNPTGARPGNEIGTGQSLPLSDRASNINAGDSRSPIAPRLPSSDLAAGAGPRAYLVAARSALAQNRTGAAQEALERAESRALDGSVLMSQASSPSRSALVQTIGAARQALSGGNRTGAIALIDAAMQDPALPPG